MWEPAFNQKEEWARNWFFKAEKVAVNLSIGKKKQMPFSLEENLILMLEPCMM
jgi:hypothetical protein